MFNKDKQITHTLILTKDGDNNKEFSNVVTELIKKIESSKLISKQESNTFIENMDDTVFTFKGKDLKTNFVKYEFPMHFRGTYLPKEVGILWNKIKHDFKGMLSTNYTEYNIYNRVKYKLKKEELNKIHKIINKNIYFRQLPVNDLFITLKIFAETNKQERIFDVAREIDEYVNMAEMPNSPTRFDELKLLFEEDKQRLIKKLKGNQEMFSEFTKTLKIDTTDAKEVINSAVDSGIYVSKYIKEFNGIPIKKFLHGWRDLFADLDLLRTKCNLDGVYLENYFDVGITNEPNVGTLWTCHIDMNFELLKNTIEE